jgi:hypothetical protein
MSYPLLYEILNTQSVIPIFSSIALIFVNTNPCKIKLLCAYFGLFQIQKYLKHRFLVFLILNKETIILLKFKIKQFMGDWT